MKISIYVDLCKDDCAWYIVEEGPHNFLLRIGLYGQEIGRDHGQLTKTAALIASKGITIFQSNNVRIYEEFKGSQWIDDTTSEGDFIKSLRVSMVEVDIGADDDEGIMFVNLKSSRCLTDHGISLLVENGDLTDIRLE